jgi:hypothetical protein
MGNRGTVSARHSGESRNPVFFFSATYSRPFRLGHKKNELAAELILLKSASNPIPTPEGEG